ncbi:leucine-rich repeat domain-containing protein [Wolbachia endosymbiont of Tribolium confusum]|uniref:leucine-rich repeat domain-containing protein n=1 Tax=Wolbachia endosymbiont of Tribolium confusum TaxID=214474 RepID=UPI001CF1E61B|nr:leucine-rich repeat domain-containing protein [Wolbachia endosymbiont of Tribolium confusum]MCA7010610.1 hypothetical protein [Wolbachia endosymbiont of Tribolium confusum]
MDFNKFVKGDFLDLYSKTINISELVSFLQSNLSITKLSLKRCYIRDEGAEALANGNLANLTQLDLSFNEIGDEGVKALANLKNLTQLNLDYNKIGDEGAKALANLKNLTQLNLDYNKIGDEGDDMNCYCLVGSMRRYNNFSEWIGGRLKVFVRPFLLFAVYRKKTS